MGVLNTTLVGQPAYDTRMGDMDILDLISTN